MIVRMEYAENGTYQRERCASVTRRPQGWSVRRWTCGTPLHEDTPSVHGLDRREAQQMARRWVETGEL